MKHEYEITEEPNDLRRWHVWYCGDIVATFRHKDDASVFIDMHICHCGYEMNSEELQSAIDCGCPSCRRNLETGKFMEG